uniref:Uncharacterized protein n=1 Tax=Molossus molossus TaxID=27622 RepID=A0A7J8CYZ1_MOLMO|nr:hypothetical protein HJG59_009430 [Molossus molossus]
MYLAAWTVHSSIQPFAMTRQAWDGSEPCLSPPHKPPVGGRQSTSHPAATNTPTHHPFRSRNAPRHLPAPHAHCWVLGTQQSQTHISLLAEFIRKSPWSVLVLLCLHWDSAGTPPLFTDVSAQLNHSPGYREHTRPVASGESFTRCASPASTNWGHEPLPLVFMPACGPTSVADKVCVHITS